MTAPAHSLGDDRGAALARLRLWVEAVDADVLRGPRMVDAVMGGRLDDLRFILATEPIVIESALPALP